MIYVKGLTFKKMRSMLKSRFSNFFDMKNSEIDVTLSYSRVITVNIVGEVYHPGSYSIPAINTAFNALIAAKGPTQIGSVRNIYIKRGGKIVDSLDVYSFLFNPLKDQDIYLQDGDYIYVPPSGNLVEVMGADAGYIALNSGLAIGAQEILIPEVNMSFENLINSLKKSKKSGKTSSIIVVAEGDKTGKNVFELASKIEETLPKYETRVSVLGHIQRGGTPSCFDRVLGTQLGVKAVESLIDGNDGNMVGIDNGKIIFTPLRKALKGKSKINKELLRISQIMNT